MHPFEYWAQFQSFHPLQETRPMHENEQKKRCNFSSNDDK